KIDVTSGHLSFDPTLDLELGVSAGHLDRFLIRAAGTLDADLSIHVVAAPDARFKIEQPVWSTQVTFVQWLGWVPVLEVADLSLGVGVDVDATAAVDVVLGGGVTAQVAAGVSYDGIAWQNLGRATVARRSIPVQLVDGAGPASV